MTEIFTIALVGNPNAGKSTLFNELTGEHQHVGNWPGKTIERKEGQFSINGSTFHLIDLPGTYSLVAYSLEESITRDFLMQGSPDAVIAVVDAANLERNLYLVAQVIELNIPVIVVLNMTDIAQAHGLTIDLNQLAAGLGVPVVTSVATQGSGLDELRAQLTQVIRHPNNRQAQSRSSSINYGPVLEPEITKLQMIIEMDETLRVTCSARWLAITLLEGDSELRTRIERTSNGAHILTQVDQIAEYIAAQTREDVETLIADRRYCFIVDLVGKSVTRAPESDYTYSDQIDRIVTHPWLGVPIFLVLMWIVFQMTANVSGIYLDWINHVLTGPITRWVVAILSVAGLSGGWLESLLVNGVISGAGSVLAFVPVLMFLYFFLALLEDSGYMARAAFVMDHFMQVLGLHGKSFIPLMVGFGCSVPGIYATRTLEDRRDRILTGLLVPFMSCTARLPIYVLIGTAFFGDQSGNLVFAMYLLGIGGAVLSGMVLRRTLLRQNEPTPFIMELPPFRRPSFKTIRRQVWDRTTNFVSNVWTIVVAASVIVWILLNVPYHNDQPAELQKSLFGDLSRGIAPVFAPAGFGTWEASGSLVTGLVAKEVVISTMSQIYGTTQDQTEPAHKEKHSFLSDLGEIITSFGQASLDTVKSTLNLIPGVHLSIPQAAHDERALQAALRDHFSPLQAVAFSVFVLLYTPCTATLGALRHELGARWMGFSIVYMLFIAWSAATLTYQIGLLVGFG